jgi:glycogen(starch) synthase
MTKRILFWSDRFWPCIGGVGLTSKRLLPALRPRGYEFTVVTLKENADLPEEDEFEGMRVCRWPLWTALESRDVVQLFGMKKRIAALKREFSPDLVHIDFLGPSVLFHSQTTDAHPAPVLVSMDSAFLPEGTGSDSLAGRILATADWVTCVSEASLSTIRQGIPETVSRSSCIYKGKPPPSVDISPIPAGPPRILCLGRLVRSKGFDLALTAFASILSRMPDARLVLGGDGPERAALEQDIARLGLESAVELLGWVDPEEVPDLINRVTLVLIPSRDDGLPNVAKEAGLMARPVVATQVGGLPEVILHQDTGLLVKPNDPDALATAALHLLENPEEAARMGQSARARVQELFDFERYVDAYDALYRRLIGRSSVTSN